MKKILLLLALVVSLSISAQQTTYFSKPLELERVPASTSKSDSILVRGVDKIIKHVPRSEFGSSQTLQQVLDHGGDYNFSTPGASIEIGMGISNGGFSVRNTNPGIVSAIYSTLGDLGLFVRNDYSNNGWEIGNMSSQFNIRSYSEFWSTAVRFPDPNSYTGNSVLTFPNKVGEHVLATLDDIPQTLQQVVNKGNFLSSNSVIAFPSTSIFSGNISMSSSTLNNQMDISGNIIENHDDNTRAEVSSDKIKLVNPVEGGGFIFSPTYGGTGTTYTNATNPVGWGAVKQVIPVSVNGSFANSSTGNIDLQIAVNNPTLTSLTLTYLNTTYPNAVNGFRVHCNLIQEIGPLIYEKTSSGWLKIVASIVFDPE